MVATSLPNASKTLGSCGRKFKIFEEATFVRALHIMRDIKTYSIVGSDLFSDSWQVVDSTLAGSKMGAPQSRGVGVCTFSASKFSGVGEVFQQKQIGDY